MPRPYEETCCDSCDGGGCPWCEWGGIDLRYVELPACMSCGQILAEDEADACHPCEAEWTAIQLAGDGSLTVGERNPSLHGPIWP